MNAGGVMLVVPVQDALNYYVVLDSGVVNQNNLNNNHKNAVIALKPQDVEGIYSVLVEYVALLNGFKIIQIRSRNDLNTL